MATTQKYNKPMFQVTKKFTGGFLKGITIKEITPVSFPVGFKCKKPCGGSPYVITDCKDLTSV